MRRRFDGGGRGGLGDFDKSGGFGGFYAVCKTNQKSFRK